MGLVAFTRFIDLFHGNVLDKVAFVGCLFNEQRIHYVFVPGLDMNGDQELTICKQFFLTFTSLNKI